MAGAKLPSADSKHFNGFRAKFHGIAGGGLRAEASRRAARRRPPASSPHNFVPVFRLPLADCKDAMTTDTHHGAEAPFIRPDVWDAQRLASLLADVGEAGLRASVMARARWASAAANAPRPIAWKAWSS